MLIGVIHNLAPGGAHRRMSEQMSRFRAQVVEVCLGTATPVRADAHVVTHRPSAPRVARPLRAPLRYTDLVGLLRAWGRAARVLRRLGVDVVYANPCRYLQSPAALRDRVAPSLYFCDEPRRVDYDPTAVGSRSWVTRPAYAPLYSAQRWLDRRGVACATRIATNSSFTAGEIERSYGRDAVVIPMGASEPCLAAPARAPTHILSVGALIPSKGHDLAIAAAARAKVKWPVIVVAPANDEREAGRLEALAREDGVELTIRIGISEAELADTYASAQATVYMAQREPFGLASLEAQAAGSPVIVAAEGGLPETIVEGRSGWAVPRLVEAVTEKLDQLELLGVRASLSTGARTHAAGATWSRSAGDTELILLELCQSSQ